MSNNEIFIPGIRVIDVQFLDSGVTSVYSITDSGENAVVDSGHPDGVFNILKSLEKEKVDLASVKYLLITHVHLDHCGGAGDLVNFLPNAKVICHEKSFSHLTNPERLVKGASVIYGKSRLWKMYGEIKGIDPGRIQIVRDEEELPLGASKIKILYTKGHANHHISLWDPKTRTAFTGDTFGLAYPALQRGSAPFIYPASTPIDFNVSEMVKSMDRIMKLDPARLALAHFGFFNDVQIAYKQMRHALKIIEDIVLHAITLVKKEEIEDYCLTSWKSFIENELIVRGYDFNKTDAGIYKMDMELNAKGIAVAVLRKKKQLNPGNPESL